MSYPARIVADDGSWMYPCEIFDVSVGGARLAVYCPSQTSLPGQFLLQLSEISQIGRSCELAWQQGNEIGVRFVREGQAVPNTNESLPSPN
jgi:PilZ domain